MAQIPVQSAGSVPAARRASSTSVLCVACSSAMRARTLARWSAISCATCTHGGWPVSRIAITSAISARLSPPLDRFRRVVTVAAGGPRWRGDQSTILVEADGLRVALRCRSQGTDSHPATLAP